MPRPNLARLGGLAAVLGGLLSAAVHALNFALVRSKSMIDQEDFSHYTSWTRG